MERKNVWKEYDAQALDRLEAFARDYRAFLDNGKTERECTAICCAEAEKRGFLNLDKCVAENRQLKAGDKVYCNWMDKVFLLFVIGKQPMEQGMNILGAVIFALSLVMLLWTLIRWIAGATVSGWASLMCSIWMIGGIQLLALGVIGEYMGKVYSEAKARPRFIIERVLNDKDNN